MMDHITIHLHESNKPTRDVVVCRNDPIQVLQNEVKAGDKHFIMFKRSILMTYFTFSYFGINDGDHIYVVPASNDRVRKSRLTSNLKSPRQEKKVISLRSGNVEVYNSSIMECTRLMDLMLMRDEFRSHMNKRISEECNKEEVIKRKTETTENHATEPSTECLPIFWESRRRFLHRV